MKVAIIFHRFGPYHCARLEAAAQECEVAGIELGSETAEYGWEKVSQPQSFERVALFPDRDSRAMRVGELEKRMGATLTGQRPDVIAIPGWSEKGALIALRWAIAHKVPVVVMSETTADDDQRAPWKEFVKRRVVGLCSAALVGGIRHRDYLVELGMSAEQIFTGYDAVDNRYFEDGAMEARNQQSEARRKHGLPENYFLASARFIAKKNLETLIRAYASYRSKEVESRKSNGEVWDLVILGDGPLKSDLRLLISNLSLDDCVLLPGFKQYDELPVYYGLANAFVHASRVEQWGLVVNEAMAAGLPVIVSERCGCAPELVEDGANGYTFEPDDVAALTQRMRKMSGLDVDQRRRLGGESRRIIAGFGSAQFATGLKQAAETASAAPPRNLNATDRLILKTLLMR